MYAWMLCVFTVIMAYSITCPIIAPFGEWPRSPSRVGGRLILPGTPGQPSLGRYGAPQTEDVLGSEVTPNLISFAMHSFHGLSQRGLSVFLGVLGMSEAHTEAEARFLSVQQPLSPERS